MVPPLLLQPLVENAVIHGIFKRPEGGQIKAGLIEHDDHYKIYVYDTGVGIARAKRKRLLRDHKRRDHIGLINVLSASSPSSENEAASTSSAAKEEAPSSSRTFRKSPLKKKKQPNRPKLKKMQP